MPNKSSVFSNPSNDKASIELYQNIISNGAGYSIGLTDVTGKVVRRERDLKMMDLIELRKSSLLSGFIFLQFKIEEKVLGHGKIVFE